MPEGNMSLPVRYLNFYRNIKGRYDLMMFLCKWDPDYRKDLIITALAFLLFAYSWATWNSFYDLVAMAVELGIIMVQLGGEMSILPADYRPAHGGVRYTVAPSVHIAQDELSYLMAAVFPSAAEASLGFLNPIAGAGLCRESPLVASRLDDTLMLRKALPYTEDMSQTNYIRSRHQLRYIAIRVANRLQHTTNGMKLALYDTAEALAGEGAVTVRKSFYFDALLTAEAFRSRIFRNNLQGEKEVYTDLTTYFPVMREKIDGQEGVRFQPDFYKQVSGHIGITTLLITENRRIAMLHQGSTKAVGSHTVTLGGSGSMNYSDLAEAACPNDLRAAIIYAMARELCEETGMEKYFGEVRRNTLLTGFFRWIDRCGKPEFVGITRAEDVPFAKERAIDGDEVVHYEEIPILINTLKDFQKVLAWVSNNKVNISLSSLMALHRMTVIATYGARDATPEQKKVYQMVSEFLFGSLAYLDKTVEAPYLLDIKKV
jgi:hypothetical protein